MSVKESAETASFFVICLAFPPLLLWTAVNVRLLRGYYASIPILHQNLIHLISSDTQTVVGIWVAVIFASYTVEYFRPVTEEAFTVFGWAHQFVAQSMLLFMSHDLTVRFLYIYNNRLVFQHVDDRDMRNFIRVITGVASAAICAMLDVFGSTPVMCLDYAGEPDKSFPRNASFIYLVLCAVCVVLNLTTNFLLWRQARQMEMYSAGAGGGSNAATGMTTAKKMKNLWKFLLIVLVIVVSATIRLVLKGFTPQAKSAAMVVVANGWNNYRMAVKEGMRRHVAGEIKG